jgi:hypothetical protein
MVNGKTRTAKAYAGAEDSVVVGEDGALEGGTVVPGFRMALRELFGEAGK